MLATEINPGDTIRVDGRVRIVESMRHIKGDVGVTVFYEGPHVGNLPRFNSAGYLNHGGFELVERGTGVA
jgi:hypothetical protein